MDNWLTLAELAGKSEVPARTIRFYIARGLLDGPVKAGRGAAYTQSHLAGLDKIKAFQRQGLTLSEIAQRVAAPKPLDRIAEPTAWWRHEVAADVVVMTKAGITPWRTRQIRAAIQDLAQRLQESGTDKPTKE